MDVSANLDATVLGNLLLLQSTLHVAPSESRLTEMVCKPAASARRRLMYDGHSYLRVGSGVSRPRRT